LNNSRFVLQDSSEFENRGAVEASGLGANQALFSIDAYRSVGENDPRLEVFDNYGSIRLQGAGQVLDLISARDATVAVNRTNALIASSAANAGAMSASGEHATILNQGTVEITGTGAVAMNGRQGATLINDGVINLGVAGTANPEGMVAMQSDGSAVLNNRRGGVINIHAPNSFAFKSAAGSGRIINNGLVHVHGTGSGLFADSSTQGGVSVENDLSYTAPSPNSLALSGYTIGTNADGSAGTLVLEQGGLIVDVDVDTGFTRGTDARTVALDSRP
jgi:putative surface-exposed virulence protein